MDYASASVETTTGIALIVVFYALTQITIYFLYAFSAGVGVLVGVFLTVHGLLRGIEEAVENGSRP